MTLRETHSPKNNLKRRAKKKIETDEVKLSFVTPPNTRAHTDTVKRRKDSRPVAHTGLLMGSLHSSLLLLWIWVQLLPSQVNRERCAKRVCRSQCSSIVRGEKTTSHASLVVVVFFEGGQLQVTQATSEVSIYMNRRNTATVLERQSRMTQSSVWEPFNFGCLKKRNPLHKEKGKSMFEGSSAGFIKVCLGEVKREG